MRELSEEKIRFLEETANLVRQDVIAMIAEAGEGHTAGSLGIADIITAFYFHILEHKAGNPAWPHRDRFVLSNGHTCAALYSALARAGYFKEDDLLTFGKTGSRLQGHPHRPSLNGLETTSGPLGSGLSQAIGMALAARLDQRTYRTYCVLSDGEQDEGNTWEAVMFAGKMKLSNMTAIIDRNNIQIDGFTEEVMPLEPLRNKYEAFNWHVIEINGHSFPAIISAVAEAQTIFEKPTMIIAHTIPGCGVSFMEHNYLWHGKAPNDEEAKLALRELKSQGRKVKLNYE